jgi:hypothetical protein
MPGKYSKIDPTSYPCKFDRVCISFDKDRYRCSHGGGQLCVLWRKYLNFEMYASPTRPKFRGE